MPTVYGDIYSGNCYKIKLLLSLLGIEHEWVHVNILEGESRTERFREMNPNGKIPVVELDDGEILFESNAILNYFADGTDYLPQDKYLKAQVLQWQFFEQYSHEPFIATSRYIVKYLGSPDSHKETLEKRRVGGLAALKLMDEHLNGNNYFVGDKYTIADISLYAYTHVAEEGGFSLGEYTNLGLWLERIAGHPRHVTMDQFADA
ncbi:MAG: glutathione S-transferase family protein [Gammaproteobacteria bacterium]|nr:glutathione S-transferase family protein [Gammaproteobacteria bacterium]